MMTAKRARALSRKGRRREYQRVKAKVLLLMKTEMEFYGNTNVVVMYSVSGIAARREKFYHWLVGKKLERQGYRVEFKLDGVMGIYW